jgi:hypothetical protein
MKYIGGVVVLLYAVVAFSGWEPFTREERGSASVRSGGSVYRSGGFMGGK